MPQQTFDSLVTQATEVAQSLVTAKHNFDSQLQSSLVEGSNNEDIPEEDGLDITQEA
ncbi:hypothetical protein H2248_003002 [Termitomyces sp. 'cryptogamus']|nr:hypothetical protein H2248_003002 [Termitomyces sp. 'cryptogamus']